MHTLEVFTCVHEFDADTSRRALRDSRAVCLLADLGGVQEIQSARVDVQLNNKDTVDSAWHVASKFRRRYTARRWS